MNESAGWPFSILFPVSYKSDFNGLSHTLSAIIFPESKANLRKIQITEHFDAPYPILIHFGTGRAFRLQRLQLEIFHQLLYLANIESTGNDLKPICHLSLRSSACRTTANLGTRTCSLSDSTAIGERMINRKSCTSSSFRRLLMSSILVSTKLLGHHSCHSSCLHFQIHTAQPTSISQSTGSHQCQYHL